MARCADSTGMMSWTKVIFSDRIRSIGGKLSMNFSIFSIEKMDLSLDLNLLSFEKWKKKTLSSAFSFPSPTAIRIGNFRWCLAKCDRKGKKLRRIFIINMNSSQWSLFWVKKFPNLVRYECTGWRCGHISQSNGMCPVIFGRQWSNGYLVDDFHFLIWLFFHFYKFENNFYCNE